MSDVVVSSVGFRDGTDDELRALHGVEAAVEVERGSHRMPRSLDDYVAFARTLPSQFHDHSWLAEASDGTPVAAGYCWYHADGDPLVMECDVLVRRDRRRQGIGLRLVKAICEATASEGRSRLTWSTFDAVPAGEAFSRRLGAGVARVNRTSELALADVDWQLVERWASADAARGMGYTVEWVVGPYPEHLRADAAAFHHIMQTAPRDDLDVGDLVVGVEFVAELDAALAASGRTRWTVFVRDGGGACVGGTEVTFERDAPTIAFQQNTGIDPDHRGLGLAKWAKAAMLLRIREERPRLRVVRTGNAFSNEPMLAINEALGFRVVSTTTDWQADVDAVLRSLRGA